MFFGLLRPRHFLLACISLLAVVIVVFILSFNMFLETSRDAVLREAVSSFPDVATLLEHRSILGVKVSELHCVTNLEGSAKPIFTEKW